MVRSVHQARDHLAQTAEALGIAVLPRSPAARQHRLPPMDAAAADGDDAKHPVTEAPDTLSGLALSASPADPRRRAR